MFYTHQNADYQGVLQWPHWWLQTSPPPSSFMFLNCKTALYLPHIWGGLISLWLYKESNKLRDWENVFTLHISPLAPHTYDFVVLTSLTHPRKILLVVLQIGKYEIGIAKDLSAPLPKILRKNGQGVCLQLIIKILAFHSTMWQHWYSWSCHWGATIN
jgi:hypothetical protein